jgi:hypothetical protein
VAKRVSGTDVQLVADSIRLKFPADVPGKDWIWTAAPALKVIDCVLSLNRNYDRMVLPRTTAFRDQYPDTLSCRDLDTAMVEAGGPEIFLASRLNYRDPRRAMILHKVNRYLIEVQPTLPGQSEDQRLHAWAVHAQPSGYKSMRVSGFAIAGFQYLRMLFGAETVKPDVWVLRFVETTLGREVGPLEAVCLFELAGQAANRSIRWLDTLVWEAGARPR